MPTADLTFAEAAAILNVTSPETVAQWLEGAYQTPEGEWRFPRAAVDALARRLAALREANAAGVVTLPDVDDDSPLPLL